MSVVRKLGGQSLYAAAGAVFTLAVGLPLQVYITRMIGAEGVGLLGVIEGVIATIGVFASFGIAPTVVRFLPWHIERGEYGAARQLISWSVVQLAVIGLVVYVGLISWVSVLDLWWPELARHHTLVVVMGLTLPLGFIGFLGTQVLRGFHDIRYMVIGNSVVQLVAKAAFTVVLLSWGWGLVGAALAMVLGIVCSIVWMGVGIVRHFRELPRGLDHGDPRQWWRYAMISYLSGIVSGVPAYFDRFILAYLGGVDVVGVLIVARRLQAMAGLPTQMLLMVGAPMFAAAHGRDDSAERQHMYDLMRDWVVRVSMPLLIFLGVFAQPVMGLFGPEFAQAGTVLQVLVVGQFFNNVSGPIGTIAAMSGLERATLWVNMVTTGVGFLLLFVLVPAYGAVGAAMSMVTGWVLQASVLVVVVGRRLGLRWWSERFGRWVFPGVVTMVVAVVLWLGGVSEWVRLVACVVLLHAVYFWIEAWRGLSEDDRELLAPFLRWVRV